MGRLLNHSKNRLGQPTPQNYAGHFQRYGSVLILAEFLFTSTSEKKGRVLITVVTLFSGSSCLNASKLRKYYCPRVSFPVHCQLSAKYFALQGGKKEMYSWVPSGTQLQSQTHDLTHLSEGQFSQR